MKCKIEKNTVQETLILPLYSRKLCTELSEIAYKWPDSQGLCPGITAGNSPIC